MAVSSMESGVGLQTSDDSIGLGQLFQQLCLKIAAVHGKADHSTALLLQQANGGIVVLAKERGVASTVNDIVKTS